MSSLLSTYCFTQSSLPTSSSSSSSPSAIYFCYRKNVKKKVHRAMACVHHQNLSDRNFLKRRVFLLVGLSAFPFLESKPRAVEGLVKDKQEVKISEEQGLQKPEYSSFQQQNLTEEQVHQQEEPANSLVGLLNELGIIGTGVLGALYAQQRKDKTAIESTVDFIRTKLIEKEAAMDFLEKDFKRKLMNEQEARFKQIRESKEAELSLSNQLTSANRTITGLRQDLQSEKRLAQELKVQIDRLQSEITQAGEDKQLLEDKLTEKLDTIEFLQEKINLLSIEIKEKETSIRNLNLSLGKKESECKNLNSICNQTKEDLAKANLEFKGLEKEALKAREELDLTKSLVDNLNARIKSLLSERDDINKKLDALKESYNDLKSSSAKKAAADSELLYKKDQEVHKIEEKLRLALNEASSNQTLISDLTKERDSLRIMLEKEVTNVKKLTGELQITQETLGASRIEAADLSKQLIHSKRLCEELTLEVSRIRAEFAEAQKSLERSLDETKSTSKELSDELVSVKEVLKKTKEELLGMSDKLKATAETREGLKKELLEIYKKAELTAHNLKEERKAVSSLNKAVEASEKQILKDKEARRALERDLEEATRSLDEMNKNTLLLSRELEISNSRTANLEAEKDMLYNSLIEQKDAAKEARENVEDAHNLLMRLGEERENLERRAKKMEEELGSAKGEILRLRRQINTTSGSSINEHHQQKSSEAESGASVVVKKSIRRRKGGPTSDVSQ
eukprot:TRINITY_DN3046_c0_g1_i1.p1 TRINITY_DN3046_c0_g1~~TRINITY_DN3046_c0_g1_i1.p1  ORF type:complete len:739 (-),score=202.07 TRINITY_DN3046_c0_g1_i1:108-2324(-)